MPSSLRKGSEPGTQAGAAGCEPAGLAAEESLPLLCWLTPAHSGMRQEQGLVDTASLGVLRGLQGHTLEPQGPQIAPLPSPTCFSRANLFLGSYCFSFSCSSPFIPLSPLAFPRVLVQGTYLPIACSHTSTSSALWFSSQVTCSLPLSWQEAACRITNTDLASRLTPPPQGSGPAVAPAPGLGYIHTLTSPRPQTLPAGGLGG